MTTHDQPEWPGMENYSDTPMFNTKAVVQQTGVPAPTLRAWERRYALLNPERGENTYRLYSERDIALVRWLKEHVDKGMSISQAVALFRHLEGEQRGAQGHKNQQKEQKDIHFDIFAEKLTNSHMLAPSPRSIVEHTTQAEVHNGTPKQLQPDSPLSRPHYSGTYDMHSAQEQLLEAFQNLDEQRAHFVMGLMLSLYPVEQVCLELVTPTLWEVGSMWADGRITVAIEHFASNFFRAVLTNIFHMTPNPQQRPLVLTCCAPGESHELAALMLSLFLRRRGMHVVYLGQSIETTGLVHTIEKLSPALVCVSITIPENLSSLANLGQEIERLRDPRPLFAFGGQAFAYAPESARAIPGIHLEGSDLRLVIQQLLTLLADHSDL
ncbi:MAG: cobalamin-dependent protein [Ktedonobacteraceae bacterium]